MLLYNSIQKSIFLWLCALSKNCKMWLKNNRKGLSINDMTFHRVYCEFWWYIYPSFNSTSFVTSAAKIKDGQKIMNLEIFSVFQFYNWVIFAISTMTDVSLAWCKRNDSWNCWFIKLCCMDPDIRWGGGSLRRVALPLMI